MFGGFKGYERIWYVVHCTVFCYTTGMFNTRHVRNDYFWLLSVWHVVSWWMFWTFSALILCHMQLYELNHNFKNHIILVLYFMQNVLNLFIWECLCTSYFNIYRCLFLFDCFFFHIRKILALVFEYHNFIFLILILNISGTISTQNSCNITLKEKCRH